MTVLRVRESFACSSGGFPRVYQLGDLLDSNDPVAKGRGAFLEPAEETAQRTTPPPVVEQATAAPGEKRSARIPRPSPHRTAE